LIKRENISGKFLSIRNLKTHFFTSHGVVTAVDDVSIEIDRSQMVGLVGESGCGKTITGRSILNLVPNPPGRIVGGQIIYEGVDLLKISIDQMRHYRGNKISMVFQDPLGYLNPVLKIGKQISEAITLHQGRKHVSRIMPDILELVGFPRSVRIWERYPHELSGGMRQRVLLAMALSCEPNLLIADEPTTALDVTIQAQILDLIKNICNEKKMALLLITHDFGIVAEICDYIYVMYAGKIVESADVFSLFEKPHHPYTQGLLDSVLSIEEYKENLKTIDGIVPNLISLPPGCRFAPRCKKARGICFQQDPPKVVVDPDGNHHSFCWIGRAEYKDSSEP